MFKKKTNLPPKPPYPKNVSIFEDLHNVEDSDVLFTLVPLAGSKFPSIVASAAFNKNNASSSDYELHSNINDPEKCYHKMKTFDEKVEYTEKNIEILREQHEKLLELKQNLLEDIEKVKKACVT